MPIKTEPCEGQYKIKFAGPLEPGDGEIVMKADLAIDELSTDIVYPVVRYPQDAQKADRKYEVSFTMQVESGILEKLDQMRAKSFSKWWIDRYCHENGDISGKGVRRIIGDIRKNSPVIHAISVYDRQRRPVIETVTANIGRMNPNKVARLIRRKLRSQP